MVDQQVTQFVAMTPAGLHSAQHEDALFLVGGGFQAGCNIVLLVYRQREGEDDAISFLTGHLFHPIPGELPRAVEKMVAVPVLWRKTATRAESPIDPQYSESTAPMRDSQ